MEKTLKQIAELIELVKNLRDPIVGDPWILAQDFNSLTALTIEEAYEFAASVQQQDYAAMSDELGDLLLHIVLYTRLAEEQQTFNLFDIAESAVAKQQRRKLHFKHPEKITAKEALEQWEKNKKRERSGKTKEFMSVLADMPATLPSLNRAYKLQTQAATVGFDWADAAPVFAKFTEELAEINEILPHVTNQEKLTEEVGDLLFTCVNLARKLAINPDAALMVANKKFESRFKYMEKIIHAQGKTPEDLTLAELDKIWEQAKLKV